MGKNGDLFVGQIDCLILLFLYLNSIFCFVHTQQRIVKFCRCLFSLKEAAFCKYFI